MNRLVQVSFAPIVQGADDDEGKPAAGKGVQAAGGAGGGARGEGGAEKGEGGEEKKAGGEGAPPERTSIEVWLRGINPIFEEYAPVFHALGLEDTLMFSELDAHDDRAMVSCALAEAGAKVFHQKKIIAALKEHTAAAAAATVATVGTSSTREDPSIATSADPGGGGMWEATTAEDLVEIMVGLETVSDFCVVADLQKIAAAKKGRDPTLWTDGVAKAFGVLLRKIAANKE